MTISGALTGARSIDAYAQKIIQHNLDGLFSRTYTMRGNEFAELKAFAAIVQHKSFARAADHLAVSPSALSQTIRALEERLGVRLLNRTTRSVAPSEAGARLLERLAPALEELEASVAAVTNERGKLAGTLRINLPRICCDYFIAPMLGAFHRAHPDIVLDLFVDDAIVDIVAGGFDAGIRLGERLAKDMVAIKIGDELELMALASKDYLARCGKPQKPQDLHLHRCINIRMPTRGAPYRWEFAQGRREFEISVEGPLIVNDPATALRAAMDGLGIAYVVGLQAASLIAEGKLVRVLENWSPRFPGFYLYYPSHRQVPPILRAFVQFLKGRRKT
jgi:DNA-binding transcriptional LysR family regulator